MYMHQRYEPVGFIITKEGKKILRNRRWPVFPTPLSLSGLQSYKSHKSNSGKASSSSFRRRRRNQIGKFPATLNYSRATYLFELVKTDDENTLLHWTCFVCFVFCVDNSSEIAHVASSSRVLE